MRPIHALSLVAAVVALLLAGLFFVGRDPLPSDVAGPALIDGGSAVAPARPETSLFAPEEGAGSAQRSVPQATATSATTPAAAAAGAPGAGSFRLRGRVVGARGEPIAGATVYAANVGGMRDMPLDAVDPRSMPWVRRSESKTGADGRFEIALDAQAGVRLAVRAAGFAPHDAEVAIAGAEHDIGDVALTPSVVLEGRVVDTLGRAVAGAELHRLAENSSRFVFVTGARGPVVARTDEQGLFRVDQLASGPWRLLVTSADHPDKTESGEVETPGTVVGDLVFTLEDGTDIEGRVVGAPPETLANLWVRAQPRRADAAEGVIVVGEAGVQPSLGGARTARVAPDGSFTLRGLKRDVNYRLSGREGEREFLARTRTVAVPARPGDRGVLLPYKPETALVFQVVDAATGLPVTELDVQAGYRWKMPLLDDASRPLRQFPDGRVRFGTFPGRPEGADGERAQLLVEAAGYRAYERTDLALVDGQDSDLGVIRLERAPVVVVTVVDDASGTPVVGARVSLEEEREESGTERRFAFNLGGGDSEDTFVGGGSAQRAKTDAEGRARVTSLPGKRATIRVRSSEHAPWQSEVLLLPLAEDVERTVRAQVGGDVLVRVVDSKGEPVARASVEHQAPGAPDEPVFRPGGEALDETDANGRVAFAHLAPGVHRFRLRDPASAAGPVRVMRGGRRGGGPQPGSGAPWTEVTVAERAEEELELVAPARGRLEGTIAEGGGPLAGATVRLSAKDDDMPSIPMFGGGANQAKTSGKGRYEIENVQEGEYRLTITHPSRAMPYETEMRIREGDNDFDVDLAVAVIEGRVEGADGKPLAGIRVRAERGAGSEPEGSRRVAFTSLMIVNDGGDTTESSFGSALPGGEAVLSDADGRYRLRGVLPDVDLVVKASGKDHQAAESKTLRLHPDETQTGIDFKLELGGVIEATVVRADGRPGTSCMVRARHAGPESGADEPKNAFTGGSGSAKLAGLKPGKWTVEVEPIGLAASDDAVAPAVQTVEVVVGRSTPVRFEIP